MESNYTPRGWFCFTSLENIAQDVKQASNHRQAEIIRRDLICKVFPQDRRHPISAPTFCGIQL